MPSRYQMLQAALAGYDKTGIPLVAYDGKVLKPAGFSDDIGIYYFIPKISHALHIPVSEGINFFFAGIMLVALVLGIIGSFLLFRTWLGKCIAMVGLLGLSLFSWRIGDVYLASTFITVAVVPLFLYLARSNKNSIWFSAFVFLAGTSIGVANYIRGSAGTVVLIFMILIVAFYLRIVWKQKIILISLLVVGMLVSTLFFSVLLNQRDNYLINNQPGYKQVRAGHPFWHPVYLGFGFLDNRYGIKYLDEVAFNKVHSISPKTPCLSQEYNLILKREVFKLVREHPYFVITTLFAKLGVIIFYILVFANFGLLAAIFYPKHRLVESAFWTAMGFSSLYGLLVIPNPNYLLGLIAFAVIYSIVSINHAIEQGAWKDIAALSSRIGVG